MVHCTSSALGDVVVGLCGRSIIRAVKVGIKDHIYVVTLSFR